MKVLLIIFVVFLLGCATKSQRRRVAPAKHAHGKIVKVEKVTEGKPLDIYQGFNRE